MADYLTHPALGSSGAKTLATQSALKYRERDKTSTPAQTLGTLAHLAILEPVAFLGVLVEPKAPMNTNAGKAIMVEWLAEVVGEPTVKPPPKAATGVVLDLYLGELRPKLAETGRVVMSRTDFDLALGMRDALMSRSDTAAVLAQAGQAEITGLCDDPDYRIPCKIRPDKLLDGDAVIISLKTCQSVGERDYLRTALTYGYPCAAWFYRRMMQEITGEAHQYWEIAVESAPPHDALLIEYTDREIAEGEAIMRRGMMIYGRCMDSGIWPGSGWDWDQMDYSIKTIGRAD